MTVRNYFARSGPQPYEVGVLEEVVPRLSGSRRSDVYNLVFSARLASDRSGNPPRVFMSYTLEGPRETDKSILGRAVSGVVSGNLGVSEAKRRMADVFEEVHRSRARALEGATHGQSKTFPIQDYLAGMGSRVRRVRRFS